jgi:hypothetical protein
LRVAPSYFIRIDGISSYKILEGKTYVCNQLTLHTPNALF